MIKIIHISDLQIPRIAKGRLEQLAGFINSHLPEIVIITGDFTQRARAEAFLQAKMFLSSLKTDFLSIPGNHDIPLYRVYERFTARFKEYKTYISHQLNPTYEKAGIAIAGINTARALVFKKGRVNPRQVDHAYHFIKNQDFWFRIIATHHPLAIPFHYNKGQLADGAKEALRRFGLCHVDLFLSGHYHVSTAMSKRIGIQESVYDSVFVQAGTLSERVRDEPFSFNFLHIDTTMQKIENYHLTNDNQIYLAQEHVFHKEKEGWKRKIMIF
jgi:3',5'-cyclic AMP phosphodiesterase CpdA